MSSPPRHPVYGVVRAVTPFVSVLLADNPSALTLDGTNTWLLRAPSAVDCVVVDPGPDDDQHLALIAEYGVISSILLTHEHWDHADGARKLAERTGASVRSANPMLCWGADPLRDGELVTAAGLTVRVIATPGHTADSVSFFVDCPEQSAVCTGDTILGIGTTFVDDLRSYVDSLRRLAGLPQGILVLPGHGPELADLRTIAGSYLAHRVQRLAEVRAALAKLGPDATAIQIVDEVYPGVTSQLREAAVRSAQAQLDYLRAEQ